MQARPRTRQPGNIKFTGWAVEGLILTVARVSRCCLCLCGVRAMVWLPVFGIFNMRAAVREREMGGGGGGRERESESDWFIEKGCGPMSVVVTNTAK